MTKAGRTCHHCRQWVDRGEPHNCWTTTEGALTGDLPDDLREAWDRLREAVAEHGEQRIYASHHCIMFARTASYAFVRPKRSALEVSIFLGRTLKAPQVRSARAVSRVKVAHIVHVRHRDQVEPPLTDWLREAYDVSDELGLRTRTDRRPATGRRSSTTRQPASPTPSAAPSSSNSPRRRRPDPRGR